MNLNVSEWKPFTTKKLFRVFENGKANQQMLEEGEDCFYVGAKRDDNGVMIHCKRDEALITKGNCVVFICNGQGSVGYANYMNVDFIGTTDIVAGYNDFLNAFTGTFLAAVYSQERPKYSFGRKWKTHLKDTVVQLPARHNDDGTIYIDETHRYSEDGFVPDWKYMEDYIKSLHSKPLTTQNKPGQVLDLKLDYWKEFNLQALFGECERGVRIKIDDRIAGDIPFCTAGELNEGISGSIGNPEAKTYNNALTIDMFGNCFYHGYDFKCDDNILVITNPHINEYSGVFISKIISVDKYRNNYGRQYRQKDYLKQRIKLPVDSEVNPDWRFMEDYIKALPYGDRLK